LIVQTKESLLLLSGKPFRKIKLKRNKRRTMEMNRRMIQRR